MEESKICRLRKGQSYKNSNRTNNHLFVTFLPQSIHLFLHYSQLGFQKPDLGLCNRKLTLSQNNACFRCNIAITSFLVSHMFEIRLHDVKRFHYKYVYILTSSYAKRGLPTWSNEYVLEPFFFLI